jgi:hypothetical protein
MSNTNSRYLEGELQKGNLSILPGYCPEDGDGSIQVAGSVFTNNIYEYTDGDPVNVNGTLFHTDGTFGNVIITSTTPGLNKSTGSLVLYGGTSILGNSKHFGTLTISNTTISTNACSGAFVVSGGVGVNRDLNVGGNINALGVVSLYNTQSSISSSIGSLLSFGGISIQNTVNASSFTSGGGLTVAGGASIAKDLYVNGTISSNFLNVGSGKFNYISVGNLNTNLFSVANLSSTFTTLANLYSNFSTIANSYLINSSISNLSVTTENVTNSSISNLNVQTILSNYGTFDFMTVGSIYVTNELGYNDIVTNISTSNINSTFGTFGNLFVNNITSNNLVSRLINVTSTIQSFNSNLASVTLAGGLSINCNVNSSSGTEGGALTIAGGASIKKDLYISGILDMNGNVITNVTSPSFDLQVANKWYIDNRTAGTVYGNFTQFQVIIGSTTGSITSFPSLLYDDITLSILSTEDATSLTNGGSLYISGGASINKSVYIGQNAHILGYLDMNNQNITSLATPNFPYDAANKYYVDSKTYGNLSGSASQGQVIIGTSSGNLTGFSSFTFDETLLSLNSTTNSIGLGSGGTLNVLGGASITKDLYVGLNIFTNNISTSNISSLNSTFSNIINSSLTSDNIFVSGKIPSYNNTTGSIISLGGISINNTTNSISITSGGGLTIFGGASILKDLYIGGTTNSTSISTGMLFSDSIFNNNLNNTNTTLGNLLNSNSTITNLNCSFATIGSIISTYINSSVQTIGNILSSFSNITNLTNANSTINNLLVTEKFESKNSVNILSSTGTLKLNTQNTMESYALTFPSNLPSSSGSIVNVSTTGSLSFQQPTFNEFYNLTSLVSNVKIWTGTGIVVTGVVSFYPTIDGSTGGTAIFSSIFYTSAMAIRNVATPINVVLASLNDISINFKRVRYNIVSGVNIGLIGGNTLIASPNGTVVNCIIYGI